MDAQKSLEERGLKIRGKMFRQVSLGAYGRADLMTYEEDEENINVTIYELKLNKIDVSALMQACRYSTAIKRHLKRSNKNKNFHIKICLIGEKMEKTGDFPFLYNELGNVEIYEYFLTFEGLFFMHVTHNQCKITENLEETLFDGLLTIEPIDETILPY